MSAQQAAVVLAAMAGWLVSGRVGSPLLRLRPAGSPEEGGSAARVPLVEDEFRRTVVCLGGGAVLGWTVAGLLLAGVGAAAGAAVSWWVGRLEPPRLARQREQVERDLPLAIDLLAACAEVGLPIDAALRSISAAIGGPLQGRFDAVTARLQLGGDPRTEWSRLRDDAQLGSLGRTLMRTVESGAPVVDGLTRLAVDRRREQRTRQQLRARSVGVRAAGPLAVCFLPAFLLVGVVPTVASAFSTLVL